MDQNNEIKILSQDLAGRINFLKNHQRKIELTEKLTILMENGFHENLFHEMDPIFFVEKGFSISEALLITKGKQSFHPTFEDIQRLVKDDTTNILKIEYIKPNLKENLNMYYILVMGPKKRGKTTVIFNLINALYNIKRDSLYRVKKNTKETNSYYDEYFIQITPKDCYVFVDFKGMGDFELDFLGQDLNGKNTLFTTILQYIQNKTILSVLYVNSSSINKFNCEEHYYLQRFFEILPKSLLKRIIFILTYCTDNQPLLNIYTCQNNTAMPQEMKEIIINSSDPLKKDEQFWFGINNSFLYQRINYRKQNQFKDIQAVIDGQQYLDVLIQRNDGTVIADQDFLEDNETQDIQYAKLCYDQMLQTSQKILGKLSVLRVKCFQETNEIKMYQDITNFEQQIQNSMRIDYYNLENDIQNSNTFFEIPILKNLHELLSTQEGRLTKFDLGPRINLLNDFCTSITLNYSQNTPYFLAQLIKVKKIYSLINSKQIVKEIHNRIAPPPIKDLNGTNQWLNTNLIRNQNPQDELLDADINIQFGSPLESPMSLNDDGTPSRCKQKDNGSFVFHLGQEQSPLSQQRRDSAQ